MEATKEELLLLSTGTRLYMAPLAQKGRKETKNHPQAQSHSSVNKSAAVRVNRHGGADVRRGYKKP